MNSAETRDQSGSTEESTSAPPTTNTTTNSQSSFLHPALSFAFPQGSLDPSLLLTPGAAAAVAAVAQQIAQSGNQHTMSSHASAPGTHPALANLSSSQNFSMPRQQSDPTNENALSNALAAGLAQPPSSMPRLALLNAGLSLGANWSGMNVVSNSNSATTVSSAPSPQLAFSGASSKSSNSLVSSSFQGIQTNAASMVAAAAHVAAAQAAMSSGVMADTMVSTMKTWKLEQLEEHAKVLQQLNQPIPQSMSILLSEARRKEEKRSAKRVANRKSACTSRARKKALVEEMTKTNARLRRQALILSLLPDMVIAMTVDGEITFCSAQVERILKHKTDDLVGASLWDLMVPSSREAMRKLVHELVTADQSLKGGEKSQRGTKRVRQEQETSSDPQEHDNGNQSAQSTESNSGAELSSGAIAVVSDQSFPLRVVQVENQQQPGVTNAELTTNTTVSTKALPAFAGNNDVSQSLTASSLGNSNSNSGEDEGAQGARTRTSDQSKSDESGQRDSMEQQRSNRTSSDDSYSSSSDAKRLRQANANLERNVRWHKEKLMGKSITSKSKLRHVDDVTGASVTTNNASARLSSLQHHPKSVTHSPPPGNGKLLAKKPSRYESMEEQSSSEDSLLAGVEEKKKNENKNESSDDSGYRESNGSLRSREDTSSSDNEYTNASGRRKRRKPLAPTCNICLIRDDLSTIWCEVTSSLRTRILQEESIDILPGATSPKPPPPPKSGRSSASLAVPKGTESAGIDEPVVSEEVKEFLLCLRPIRDGEQKVDESLRFTPSAQRLVDDPVRSSEFTVETPPSVENWVSNQRPLKKRLSAFEAFNADTSSGQNVQGRSTSPVRASDAEKSVVESLILMSHKKSQ